MDLNQVEKRLTEKSVEEINECASVMVHTLQRFVEDKVGKTNGIHWATNRDYQSRTGDYTYQYNHLDYKKLEKLIARIIQHDHLDDMVKQKATELCDKLELLS